MKKTIQFLFFLLPLAAFAVNDGPIQLSERKEGARTYISARNVDSRLTRWVQVSLAASQNVGADRGLPVRAVLRPGESRDMMAVSPIDPSRNSSYALTLNQGFGDPEANSDLSVAYLLPFEHGTKHQVSQGYLGSVTHQGLYALDFEMPEGTTLCAARDGVVATAKDDSDSGGASPAFARLGNYIDLLHDDGTWSTYAHLKHGGALVHEGDRVKAGDPIGLSGQTGQATGPHMHFSVQKARWAGTPETFATPFALDASTNAYLEEGKYYYAWHPGLPDFERVDVAKIDLAALELKVTPISGGKVRFREEKIDNLVLLYGVNPLPQKIELTVLMPRRQDVETSRPLPVIKVVPAGSEVFLMSVLMKGMSSYQLAYSYRILP